MSLSVKADPIQAVSIPPRPALLMALQRELSKELPHLKKVAELINRDVAIAGSLLATANSAFFNQGRPIHTVMDALALLGVNRCTAVLTGLMAKRVLQTGGMMMPRFWDVSEKRAKGLSFIAKEMRVASPEMAYNFGLFCDIGIPIMRANSSAYLQTLAMANLGASERFLDIENANHGINHAHVGRLLAEKWGIASDVVAAIALHHTPSTLSDPAIPASIRMLVASNYLVEKAIQQLRGEAISLEWLDAGARATQVLGLSVSDAQDFCEQIVLRFKERS